jgi:hypothetical protein
VTDLRRVKLNTHATASKHKMWSEVEDKGLRKMPPLSAGIKPQDKGTKCGNKRLKSERGDDNRKCILEEEKEKELKKNRAGGKTFTRHASPGDQQLSARRVLVLKAPLCRNMLLKGGTTGVFGPMKSLYGVDWRSSRFNVCASMAKHGLPGGLLFPCCYG